MSEATSFNFKFNFNHTIAVKKIDKQRRKFIILMNNIIKNEEQKIERGLEP